MPGVKSLQVLWLESNRLADQTEVCVVSGNRLLRWLQALCGLTRLQTLDLTRNKLEELPAVPGAESLQDLRLESNRLVDQTDLCVVSRNRLCL